MLRFGELGALKRMFGSVRACFGGFVLASMGLAFPTPGFSQAPTSQATAASTAPAGQGELVIYRERAFFGFAMSPTINVNNTEVGSMVNGSVLRMSLPAGDYDIHMYSGAFGPNTRDKLTVLAGQTSYFQYDVATSVSANLIFSFASSLAPPKLLPQSADVALKAMEGLQVLAVPANLSFTPIAPAVAGSPATLPAVAAVTPIAPAAEPNPVSTPAPVAATTAVPVNAAPAAIAPAAPVVAPATSGMATLASGQVRIGVHRFVGPRESGFATAQNVDAVPTNDEGKQRYRQYLGLPTPKVVTVSQSGAVRFWVGHEGVMRQALGHCAQSSADPCWLYAVDDRVVWSADPQARVGRPEQVAMIP